MSKTFQHEWGFMANGNGPGWGDLVYCPLCNQWKMVGYKGGKPFKMSNSEFMEWHISNKVNATETLGSVEETKKAYKLKYGEDYIPSKQTKEAQI